MEFIKKFILKIIIFVGYCMPALVALYMVIPSYQNRTKGIAQNIKTHAIQIRDLKFLEDNNGVGPADSVKVSPEKPTKREAEGSLGKLAKVSEQIANKIEEQIEEHVKEDLDEMPEKEKKLKAFFHRQEERADLDRIIDNIDKKIAKIFSQYTIVIALMTLLPFALLGMKIAFREKRKDIVLKDRYYSVVGDWWMKFLVAYTMATGWLYTVNPEGRGGTTLSEYINTQDMFTNTTLPGFILSPGIPLVVAGFLGWYLNLVSYFISKLYYDDVYGTRIYRFLVGKLLFVYGISLVLSSVDMEQGKVVMFLIGYFPLSALSILKESGTKAMQGGAKEKGALIDLPAISRNQILRLHEEGIDSINTLASYPRVAEVKKYQYAIAPMVDLWVDYSRLYSIVGHEDIVKIKGVCTTASEFLYSYKTPKFRKDLEELQIKNPDEIARLIRETFSFDKTLVAIKPKSATNKKKN